MGRRPVDVEELVVWACSELSRRRPANVHRLPVLNVRAEDRTCLGRWAWPMGYPTTSPMFAAGLARSGGARGDPPHADAFAIEAAILALRVTCGEPDERAVGWGIGVETDAKGALAASISNLENLLIVHGRLARRPSLPDMPQVRPKRAANGAPGVFVRELAAEETFAGDWAYRGVTAPTAARRGGIYPSGAFCELIYEPEWQEVVNDRADYWIWRLGLAALAAALEGQLESRFALPPRAASAPWTGETDDGGPVPDLYSPVAEGVYDGDAAATLRAERGQARRRPRQGGSVYGRRPAKPAKGAASGA